MLVMMCRIKFVPISGENSIEANDYNLNIPRYIQPADTEICQDIDAHLHGGIPKHDVEQLSAYWTVCPSLRSALFDETAERITLRTDKATIANVIVSSSKRIIFLAPSRRGATICAPCSVGLPRISNQRH